MSNLYYTGKETVEIEDCSFSFLRGLEVLTMSFSDSIWLIKDLIEDPSANLLVGAPGANKSLLSQALALSLASGRDFLGHFRVTKPRRVVYVQTESGKRGFIQRLQKLATAMDISPIEIDETLTVLTNQPFRLDNAGHVALIAQHQPDLVILDALRDFHTQDENSSEAMKPMADNLRWLRDQHGISSLTLHHTNKAPDYVEGADKTRGTTAFWAAMDGRFYITLDKKTLWVTMHKPYLKEHGTQPTFKFRPCFEGDKVTFEWQPVEGSKPITDPSDHPLHHVFSNYREAVEGQIVVAFMEAEESTINSLKLTTGKGETTIRRTMESLQTAGWANAISSNSKGGRGNAKVFAPTSFALRLWGLAAA